MCKLGRDRSEREEEVPEHRSERSQPQVCVANTAPPPHLQCWWIQGPSLKQAAHRWF